MQNSVVILRGVVLCHVLQAHKSLVHQSMKVEEEASMLLRRFSCSVVSCFLISSGGFFFGARREGIGLAVSYEDFAEQDFLNLPVGCSSESAELLAH